MTNVRATFRIGLVLTALMGTATQARADPVTWGRLCAAVGDFAGLVAVYRNEGAPQSVATAMTRSLFGSGPPELLDRTVSDEIARQVYATPSLSPQQETDALKAKCLTPEANAAPRKATRTAPSEHVITNLVPIPLDRGVNRIEAAAPGGRAIDVVLDWHDDGDGRGHDVFLVRGPGDADPSKAVTLADDPHEGDDVLSSIRFARADVDGQPEILVLTASRASPAAKVVPTQTVFAIYRLVPGEPGSGSPVTLELLERRTLADRFCNADRALSAASGLPLRQSYRGPRDAEGRFTANGCPEAMTARSSSR
jgi:hypothetical protein